VFTEIKRLGEEPSICYDDPPAVGSLRGRLFANNEVLDLAVLRLDSEAADILDQERFLGLSDLAFQQDLVDGWYFLHGYPYLTSYTSNCGERLHLPN
jgi:hypothetical protein